MNRSHQAIRLAAEARERSCRGFWKIAKTVPKEGMKPGSAGASPPVRRRWPAVRDFASGLAPMTQTRGSREETWKIAKMVPTRGMKDSSAGASPSRAAVTRAGSRCRLR